MRAIEQKGESKEVLENMKNQRFSYFTKKVQKNTNKNEKR